MKLGTTFSSFQASQMRQPLADVLNELFEFRFDVIRIGSYWNSYEKTENSYDYSELEYIVSECQKHNQKIILTVGAKSPRWPEFHMPQWAMDSMKRRQSIRNLFQSPVGNVSDEIVRSVEHTVSYFKKYDCIQTWQVENEPLDPSGPDNWTIPDALLTREVELVQSIDSRPVMVTIWGNTLSSRGVLQRLPPSVDVLGIDLYYKVPNSQGDSYTAPEDDDASIHEQVHSLHKPVIITELQAEPWEHHSLSSSTPSMNPQILEDNIRRVSEHIQADQILLWGFEYWYTRKQQGDTALWDIVENSMKP